MSLLNSLQGAFAAAQGVQTVPGTGVAGATGNAGLTSTAVNLIIVVNGIPQGLIKTLTIDEQFNYQRVKAIGSAVDVAFVPGVYEATGTINRAFLYGQSIETAFGGGLRAVVGKYQANPDFTSFYFNVIATDVSGSPIAIYHDCIMGSVRKTIEIDQVVIIEDVSLFVRWSEQVA